MAPAEWACRPAGGQDDWILCCCTCACGVALVAFLDYTSLCKPLC